MDQLTIFLIGFLFLLFFSYRDLKYSKVENYLILIYLFSTLGVLLITGNYLIQIAFCLFWILFSGILWYRNCIGGADLKILIINSIYISLIVPNVVAGQFMFIMIFGINGLLYGVLANLIKLKKEIPFITIITLTYVMNYLFWIV